MNRKERRAAGERGPRHPTVQLAYIHPGEVSATFMTSVLRCRDYEMLRTHQLFALLERRARSGSIAKARNEITKVFLKGECEWLWFVDADMGFPADALQKMLAVAHPKERPIVGALAFALSTTEYDEETNAEYNEYLPTIQVWDKTGANDSIIGFKVVYDYPSDALVQCDASGAACVMIHRNVLTAMQAKFGEHWFTQIPHPVKSEPYGEDTSFYLRASELGWPVIVHTGVRTSHDKGGVMLTERLYQEQRVVRDMKKQMEELDDRSGESRPAPVGSSAESSGRPGLRAGSLPGDGPAEGGTETGDRLALGHEIGEAVGDAGDERDRSVDAAADAGPAEAGH